MVRQLGFWSGSSRGSTTPTHIAEPIKAWQEKYYGNQRRGFLVVQIESEVCGILGAGADNNGADPGAPTGRKGVDHLGWALIFLGVAATVPLILPPGASRKQLSFCTLYGQPAPYIPANLLPVALLPTLPLS